MPKNKTFDAEKFCNNRDLQRSVKKWEVNNEDFLLAYEAGIRDFRGANITSCDFSGVIFKNIILRNARIVRCNFSKADLSESDLNKVYIDNSNFSSSIFTGSDISNAYIECSNFNGSLMDNLTAVNINLGECSLINATLNNSKFQYASLYRDDLDSTKCNETVFDNASLDQCNLFNALLSHTSFLNSNIRGVNFAKAKMTHVNFIGAIGLYTIFTPSLSSRLDSIYGSIHIENNKIVLRYTAGCKERLTEQDLINNVKNKHGDNSICGIQYLTAIKAIKTMFKNDIKYGTWNYHLDLYDVKYVE